jgi:hypothetical protein
MKVIYDREAKDIVLEPENKKEYKLLNNAEWDNDIRRNNNTFGIPVYWDNRLQELKR